MQSDFLSPLRQRRLANYIKHLSGLVAYYPLNEVSGSIAKNQAPSTLGSLNGVTTGCTIGQAGKVGRAYSFDGVNDDMVVSANSVFNTDSFSIFLLINPAQLRIQGVIGKGAFVNAWRVFMNDTNGTLEFDTRSDADNIEATTDISLNTWTSLGVSFNKTTTTATIYINGVAAGTTATFTNAGNDNNSDLKLAPTYDNPFNGLVQHTAYFNRIVTATEYLKLARIAGLA